MSVRDQILKRLREDAIGPGPGGEREEINERPSERYLTGILYPQSSKVEAEDDSEWAEEQGRGETEDSLETGVSLFRAMKPSTAGLSFAVDKACRRLDIRIKCGIYEVEEIDSDSGSESRKRRIWKRRPVNCQISADVRTYTLKSDDTGLDGLAIYIRKRDYKSKIGLTVQAVNSNKLPESVSSIDRETSSFFQFEMSISTYPAGNFSPRPILTQPRDNDEKIAALIFRKAKEYATGHTTAASWEIDDDGLVQEVRITWMPMEKVSDTDPFGDEIFKSEYLSRGMEMPDAYSIGQSSQKDIVRILQPLPSAYKKWIEQQYGLLADIMEDSLLETARENLKYCNEICTRISGGIDILKKDTAACEAFRLANEAMQIQACWKNEIKSGVPSNDEAKLKWRPFQLGFALLSLASLTDASHPDRNLMDLIWFPTGGGKTEAYLLAAAYVLFLRRLRPQSLYSSFGTSVLMRYTLRTLTIQQFQRASALICACEYIRKRKSDDLGMERFSIALWVGGSLTPNKIKQAVEAINDLTADSTPKQLISCPGCKRELDWRYEEEKESIECICKNEECVLSDGACLPVKTVDEEIYASPPSLVIGTVDKFAQIIRKKEVSVFFGLDGESPPPDLIIQDELHLITGPLGSLVGLFECAVDALCSYNGAKPKIVGSTATIRRASEQIKNLFARKAAQFPPPAIDEKNNCFAKVDESSAGRLYVGLTTAGRSDKFSLQAVASSVLQAGAELDSLPDFDPYGTVVAYFNSLRILGGALVAMQDDVPKSMGAYAHRRENEERREISEPEELTSRKASREIPSILERLGIKFSPPESIDVLLASNMLSVGVDIPRLGLMIVNGQPKAISEYIQATSRVGRGTVEGLVITLYNHQKARDRSRYETFKTWHQALYRSIEGSSVTPFAPRARDKALHAILVAMSRHLIKGFPSSGRINDDLESQIEEKIFPIIGKRIKQVDEREYDSAMNQMGEFLSEWKARSGSLKYIWRDQAESKSLLISAEAAAARKAAGKEPPYAKPTPNSMRDVEPGVDFKGSVSGRLKAEVN